MLHFLGTFFWVQKAFSYFTMESVNFTLIPPLAGAARFTSLVLIGIEGVKLGLSFNSLHELSFFTPH
jgi:hypothetical protein